MSSWCSGGAGWRDRESLPWALCRTLQPNEDGVVTPIMESIGALSSSPDHVAMNEFYAHSHATPQVMARALLNPEKYYLPYELEAMLNCGANSIRSKWTGES